LGGIGHSIGQVVAPGVLLEISTDDNRAIYTGLSGAGSIMQVLYPLLAGYMVGLLGFNLVFILTSIFIVIGLYVAKTIQCSPFIAPPVESQY